MHSDVAGPSCKTLTWPWKREQLGSPALDTYGGGSWPSAGRLSFGPRLPSRSWGVWRQSPRGTAVWLSVLGPWAARGWTLQAPI